MQQMQQLKKGDPEKMTGKAFSGGPQKVCYLRYLWCAGALSELATL